MCNRRKSLASSPPTNRVVGSCRLLFLVSFRRALERSSGKAKANVAPIADRIVVDDSSLSFVIGGD